MATRNTDILISGASIAGPTLAYWLRRYGFNPTVVERAPALRPGGQAVDLFGPAADVAERMGVWPQAQAASTNMQTLSMVRAGKRPIDIPVKDLVAPITDRHVEIMRDDLARILHEPTRGEVEHVFGDSIRSIDQDRAGVNVTFEHSPSRRFDLVVGADGQHSNVRRLVFGPESRFTRHLGAYLCIFSVPNYLDLHYQMLGWAVPGKLALVYSARHNTEARAMFAFRSRPLRYDFRDTEQQQRLVRQAFAGESWEAPRLLAEMDRAPDFYFDSTSQIRMDSWSRGRVTLVGDAGYGPAPAVGGGTALAVVGAYVLAGELAAVGGDHEAAFRSYECAMREMVARSRAIAPSVIKTFIPATPYQVWRRDALTRGFLKLPVPLQRRLSGVLGTTTRALNAITLKDYQSRSHAA